MQENLFPEETLNHSTQAPLAFRMRPRCLEEFVGQEHLLGAGKLLHRVIVSDRLSSLILYGPPGCGKTSLGWLIAKITHARFEFLSAVTANVAQLRSLLDAAGHRNRHTNQRTVLFIDEIHRFNRAQQDVLMPDVERGGVILMGATTLNPFFSVNGPLLSRSLIFELKPLERSEILEILRRALKDEERGLGKLAVEASPQALDHLASWAAGDARKALTALEVGVLSTPPDEAGVIRFELSTAEESIQKKAIFYDRSEDAHYDTASAFIKSLRGSDPDAALYWLAKMIVGGEDPRFIVRRLLILASEDIGNADPQALPLACAVMQSVEFLGMPESRILLAQLVTYLALAPKSNASYLAIQKVMEDVEKRPLEAVPPPLRDASYPGAKRLGRGIGYVYPHDLPQHFVKQAYRERESNYYQPTDFGFEKILKKRLEALRRGESTDGGT